MEFVLLLLILLVSNYTDAFSSVRTVTVPKVTNLPSAWSLKLFKSFGGGPKKSPSAAYIPTSPQAIKALEIFRKEVGKKFQVITDGELTANFRSLSSVLSKSDDNALACVRIAPRLLLQESDRIKANFEVYAGKWGADKALEVVLRNPLILAVRTTGYGSAEAAGDETVNMSYVVAYTRPAGPVLLTLLFLALVKAAIVGI